MNRTVRYGLAIAGMAGGLWFLGSAVANADQTNNASQTATQSVESEGNGGGSNLGGNIAIQKNQQNTTVTNSPSIANGGTNTAHVDASIYDNTVNAKKSEDTNVTFTTNVTVNQAANGGTSNGSGNMAVNGVVPAKGGNQSNTLTQNLNQKSESEGSDKEEATLSNLFLPGSNGSGGNFGFNFAKQKNEQNTTVTNNPSIANGGSNDAWVDASIYDNTIKCPKKEECTVKFTTNVTVNQQANGGTAINSGNMGVNAPVPGLSPCTCPREREEHKAVAHKAAPAKKAVVLSAAQPTAVLATTGAEYGAPLTLGLIALGAGAGLTVAGRRRSSATV